MSHLTVFILSHYVLADIMICQVKAKVKIKPLDYEEQHTFSIGAAILNIDSDFWFSY